MQVILDWIKIMVLKVRLNDDQLQWVISKTKRSYKEHTVEMLKMYYVDEVDRNVITEKFNVTRSNLSNLFSSFEKELDEVLKNNGVRTSVIIHDLIDTSKIRTYDITNGEDDTED